MEDRALNMHVVRSGDGSHTIQVPELKEHYHSHKGALQESQYVFIQKGLRARETDDKLHILEVGFGTGLNALLTILEPRRPTIHYTTLETHILPLAIIRQLNYPQLLNNRKALDVFLRLHEATWDRAIEMEESFTLEKRATKLEEYDADKLYDVIYYDAFAPHAQPELWTPAIWNKLHSMMVPGGIMVTYCAKGQVRRDLTASGFEVERLPGPPGKREMLRATKK